MQNKKSKRISPSFIATICSIVILLGGFFLSYDYIESKKIVAYDYMSSIFYNGKEYVVIEEDGIKKGETVEEDGSVTNDYIGYLNIPKINLTKGFLNMKAPDNDVDKNILVVKGSDYPDVKNGNFIIAGHSGTGWNSFFNDLYKLSKNDTINVTYKNKTYIYKIVKIYKENKTGTIAVYRDYKKTTLTLVTCTNHDKKTQTVYIAELQEIKE